MTARTRPLVVVLCALAVPLVSSEVRAQSATALAESLFKEGKSLMAASNYSAACPKLAESARLDPESGTYYALGLCLEASGRYASAWSAFLDSASAARRNKNEARAQAATQKASQVEGRVSRVDILVIPETAKLPDVTLAVDGIVLTSASWSNAPVDAGEHRIVVKAAGKVPFETTFKALPPPERARVSVGPLTDAPVAAPPALLVVERPVEAVPQPPHASSGAKTAGFVILGIGAAGLAAGGVFGGFAWKYSADVKKACPAPTCADRAAVDKSVTAGTFADVATWAMIGGGACAAAGLIVAALAPSPQANLAIAPFVGRDVAMLSIEGRLP